jgi:hypothetical protein
MMAIVVSRVPACSFGFVCAVALLFQKALVEFLSRDFSRHASMGSRAFIPSPITLTLPYILFSPLLFKIPRHRSLISHRQWLSGTMMSCC